jgi:hypothetical protein
VFFSYFTAQKGLTRAIAAKLLMGGVVFILMGLVVLWFPMIVASMVALACFVVASTLLGGAWKVFRASRPLSPVKSEGERFEEAVWREVR